MVDEERRRDSGGDALVDLLGGLIVFAFLRTWRTWLAPMLVLLVVFFTLGGVAWLWDLSGIDDRWFWPIVFGVLLLMGLMVSGRARKRRLASENARRERKGLPPVDTIGKHRR